MGTQQFWRSSIGITEQANGWYEVSVSQRWEHGMHPSPDTYPNLTWEEVEDLIGTLITDLSEGRKVQHNRLVGSPWTQLKIFDAPGSLPS